MSYFYREIYPSFNKGDDKTLYYLEFLQFDKNDKLRWILFKRNVLMSEEKFDKLYGEFDKINKSLMSREGHPWNYGEGIVNLNKYAYDLNTVEFLKFMVDSLNKNIKEKL